MIAPCIIAAAVRVGPVIVSVPRPGRHADILRPLFHLNSGIIVEAWDQGFLTDRGDFVDRKTARRIAVEAEQLLPRHHPGPDLYSEDLW